MILNFFYNLKKYCQYLMKVGFKELLADTLILICIVILAGFAFIPVGLVADIIRSFFNVSSNLNNTVVEVFNIIVLICKIVCAVLAFIWLFNYRYNYKAGDVTPVDGVEGVKLDKAKGSEPKKEEKKSSEVKKEEKETEEKMELPKEAKKEEK